MIRESAGMTRVVIQPSFGNFEARKHWRDTLDQEVDYRSTDRSVLLTTSQLSKLDLLHPAGRARFWGSTANHDKKMSELRLGDIILFTGKNHVRAVGEVGLSFRNAAFADTLWDPHSARGSYQNVYSLYGFQPVLIRYQEIWELPGFNPNDNFMGLRFLDKEKSDVVIEGLNITSATALQEAIRRERELSAELDQRPVVIAPEAVNTTTTTYERTAATLTVNRAEALLVKAYRSGLNGVEVGRVRMPGVGVTDLHVSGPEDVEIVEAKRDSSHSFVREALGQLLDYVSHSPDPVTRLAALFPDRPENRDVALLHRYGIDCVYRNSSSTFARVEAPEVQRHYMRQVWQSS
jgi:hypothetical protein